MRNAHVTTFRSLACLLGALALPGCGGEIPAAAQPHSVAVSAADPVPGDAGHCAQAVRPEPKDTSQAPAATAKLQALIAVLDAGTQEYLPRPQLPAPGPIPGVVLLFAVQRSGNLDTSVEVHYSTYAASASEYEDYEPVHGYVAFAPQETIRYIEVPVVDDVNPECPEEFTVRIEGAHPDAVVVRAVASGAILDDDAAGPSSGPDLAEPLPPLGSDYCEAFTEPTPGDISFCQAISCATGEPLYWTYCPGQGQLDALLASAG